MDFIDIFWNPGQEASIEDLRRRVFSAGTHGTRTLNQQAKLIRLLQKQNEELRLRLGVLIRTLVQRGVISVEQFSSAIDEAKANIAHAHARATATKKLPKPPKGKLKKPAVPNLKRTTSQGQDS